jgi:hypothetical protein
MHFCQELQRRVAVTGEVQKERFVSGRRFSDAAGRRDVKRLSADLPLGDRSG